MSLTQKLFALQAQIDDLQRRVKALEPIKLPDQFPGTRPGDVVMLDKQDLGKYIWTLPSGDQLPKAIDNAEPIASATMAPPPKKRGRPPKA